MNNRINYGAVISFGYSTFFQHIRRLLPFLLMVLVISIVVGLATIGLGVWLFDSGVVSELLSAVGTIILQIISVLVTGLVSGGMVRIIRGADPATALPQSGALLSADANVKAVAIRIGVIIGALSSIGTLVMSLGGALFVALGGLVSVAAIVPIVYLSVRWYMAPVAAVAEGESADQAIARSESLATGRFWNIVLMLILIGICAMVPAFIAGSIVGSILGILLGLLTSNAVVGVISGGVGIFAMVTALGYPLAGAMVARAYLDLSGDGGSEASSTPQMQAPTYSSMDSEPQG